jgi:hypothetical protein
MSDCLVRDAVRSDPLSHLFSLFFADFSKIIGNSGVRIRPHPAEIRCLLAQIPVWKTGNLKSKNRELAYREQGIWMAITRKRAVVSLSICP